MPDSRRGGYDHAWQKARAAQLLRQPRCRCGAPATQVHHVRQLAKGGSRLDPANLQSLCTRCHHKENGRQAAERNQLEPSRKHRPSDPRPTGPPKVWVGAAMHGLEVRGPALVIDELGQVRRVHAGHHDRVF
jgi:hypothetical protein